MQRIAARPLVLLVTLALLAGGCGGGGGAGSTATAPTAAGTTAPTTLSPAAARAARIADRACIRARGGSPPPRRPRTTDELGAYVRSQALVAQRIVGALSGVAVPPSQRARLTALRRSYGEVLAAYRAALAAVPNGDATTRVASAEARTGRLAAAAGMPACAPGAAAG